MDRWILGIFAYFQPTALQLFSVVCKEVGLWVQTCWCCDSCEDDSEKRGVHSVQNNGGFLVKKEHKTYIYVINSTNYFEKIDIKQKEITSFYLLKTVFVTHKKLILLY